MKYSDLSKIGAHINGLFDQRCPFVAKAKIDGVEYGFIPELDNMTLGEYVDLDNYFNAWKQLIRPCVFYIGRL